MTSEDCLNNKRNAGGGSITKKSGLHDHWPHHHPHVIMMKDKVDIPLSLATFFCTVFTTWNRTVWLHFIAQCIVMCKMWSGVCMHGWYQHETRCSIEKPFLQRKWHVYRCAFCTQRDIHECVIPPLPHPQMKILFKVCCERMTNFEDCHTIFPNCFKQKSFKYPFLSYHNKKFHNATYYDRWHYLVREMIWVT